MYQRILVPVDLNDGASWQKAIPQAVGLAKAHGAALHVLTVMPGVGMAVVGSFFPEGYEEKMRTETEAALAAFIADHVPGELKAEASVVFGNIYQEILAAADRAGADLIVMAAHRPELKDFLLGPNAARVVRHASQSVLIVR